MLNDKQTFPLMRDCPQDLENDCSIFSKMGSPCPVRPRYGDNTSSFLFPWMRRGIISPPQQGDCPSARSKAQVSPQSGICPPRRVQCSSHLREAPARISACLALIFLSPGSSDAVNVANSKHRELPDSPHGDGPRAAHALIPPHARDPPVFRQNRKFPSTGDCPDLIRTKPPL